MTEPSWISEAAAFVPRVLAIDGFACERVEAMCCVNKLVEHIRELREALNRSICDSCDRGFDFTCDRCRMANRDLLNRDEPPKIDWPG